MSSYRFTDVLKLLLNLFKYWSKLLLQLYFVQAWERLEKAEHGRELALREELSRQERLEQLANKFDRKAAMRETWLSDNQKLVSQVKLCAVAFVILLCDIFYKDGNF